MSGKGIRVRYMTIGVCKNRLLSISIISWYRNFVCSKFYSLVLRCTAHAAHTPTNAPNGGFVEFIASVCDAGHPPHTGRVWAKCGSESDLIHFFGFTTPEWISSDSLWWSACVFRTICLFCICYILTSFLIFSVASCNQFEYTFRGRKKSPENLTDLVRSSGLFLYFLCFIRA